MPHLDILPTLWIQEKEIEQFNEDISNFLSSILSQNNTARIIGADTNSSIGVKSPYCNSDTMLNKHECYHDLDPILKLLGPHGNPHKSKMGDSILNLMHDHSLRAAIPSLTATTNITHGFCFQNTHFNGTSFSHLLQ